MNRVGQLFLGVILTTGVVGGCGSASASLSTVPPAVVVVSGMRTEPSPAASQAVERLLATAGHSNGDAGSGTVIVRTADGGSQLMFDLVPRRSNGQVDHGLLREDQIRRNVADAVEQIGRLSSSRPDLDLLDGISVAARRTPGTNGTLVVLSSGLSTAGGLDLRQVGWRDDPVRLTRSLAARGLLPDLTGIDVVFSGLGETAAPQTPLPEPVYDRLVAYWTEICRAAGARSCSVDSSPMPRSPQTEAPPSVLVPIPGVRSESGPGSETTTISDSALGFSGDSTTVSAQGQKILKEVSGRGIASVGPGRRVRAEVTGYAADPPGSTPDGVVQLARRRAQAVADLLGAEGVLVGPVTGSVAPGPSATSRSGVFNPRRAEEMRRVEIRIREESTS